MGDELGVTPNKGDEVDPAGITAYRDMTSLQPARQLIFFVRTTDHAEAQWRGASEFAEFRFGWASRLGIVAG